MSQIKQRKWKSFGLNEVVILVLCCAMLVLSMGANAAEPFKIVANQKDITAQVGDALKVGPSVWLSSGADFRKMTTTWYMNGKFLQQMSGWKGVKLSTSYALKKHSGTFNCVIKYGAYKQRCNSFNLTVVSDVVPVSPARITQHPTHVSINEGATAKFQVSASGTPPLKFQWYYNNQRIAGATSSSLSLPAVEVADGGNYYCRVENESNVAQSNIATLAVTEVSIGRAIVRWDAPTRRSDGSWLASGEIAQYQLYRYIGDTERLYATVSASQRQVTIDSLSLGVHEFAMATVDTRGLVSPRTQRFSVAID